MEGAAAEAIRGAEASLARQQTVTAQIDLQVITAVLNAHTDHGVATGALEQLQRDVETAVAARPDLGTPAGARSFQRYLIGKLREIRAVVDDADLDATSKAALAAALSALYASSDSESDVDIPAEPADPGSTGSNPAVPEDLPMEYPAEAAPAQSPAWGAAAPPPSGGFPSLSPASLSPLGTDPFPSLDSVRDLPSSDRPEVIPDDRPADADADADADAGATEGSTDVVLPGGETITAPSPELANVITAAVAGTPIAEAFTRQGITVPPPGSPIAEPVEPAQLLAGDIGIFADRHALALGNGQALLDNQIQPLSAIGGPGFIGWQHPPQPDPIKPEVRPAPVPATP